MVAARTEALIRRHESVAVVDTEDRVAVVRLYDPEQPPVLLEGTSAHIWRSLDGTRTEPELVALLARRFAVPTDLVAGDVRVFLNGLQALGLLDLGTADPCRP